MTLTKDSNHSHYWIESGELYESYNTIRGLRWRHIAHVPGMPDSAKCTEAMIIFMEKEY